MSQPIQPKALGLALGILWSLGVLFTSIVALFTHSYLHNVTDFLGTVYLGYSLDNGGIILGMTWAFFDAFIGGFLIAWLYNKLV